MNDQTAKPRVMFVDDDPMLLASTRRQLMIQVDDYELLFCSSGMEALARAAVAPPHIIFSDIRMPEMDGCTLLRCIAELYPETIRFAWTGQTESSQEERVKVVAHQIFTKPCATETLRKVIEDSMKSIQ